MIRRLAILIAAGIAGAALIYWAMSDATVKLPAIDPPGSNQAPVESNRDPDRSVARGIVPSAASRPAEARMPAVANEPAKDVDFVIRAVREDGRPIPHARIDIYSPGRRIDPLHTDAAGIARTRAPAILRAHYMISPKGAPPTQGTLIFDAKEGARISVPDGPRVAGSVTVHGKPPTEPVPLSLQVGIADSFVQTTTDEAGGFEFFNLGKSFKGAIRFPEYYRLVSEDENTPSKPQLAIEAPAVNVELKLAERPAIRGRLVQRSRNPTPIRGTVFASMPKGKESPYVYRLAGEDGWFCVIVPADLEVAVLQVADVKGLGKREIKVPGPFSRVKNLGDIEIQPARDVALSVHDASGLPVHGARALIIDTTSRSEPTDAMGRSTIRAEPGACQARVGRLGYTTAVVDVPAGSASLGVQLQPGNQLTIDVVIGDGSVKPRGLVSVELSGPGVLFAGPHYGMDPLLADTGATSASQGGAQRVGSDIVSSDATFTPPKEGPIIAAGFKPGAQVTIRLRSDACDDVLDEQQVVMGAADSRKITLRAEGSPRDFAGIVVTEGGEPVAGARVSVIGAKTAKIGPQARKKSTDEKGAFTMSAVFAETVAVEIEKKGFAPFRREGVRVPAPETPPERFVLVPVSDAPVAAPK